MSTSTGSFILTVPAPEQGLIPNRRQEWLPLLAHIRGLGPTNAHGFCDRIEEHPVADVLCAEPPSPVPPQSNIPRSRLGRVMSRRPTAATYTGVGREVTLLGLRKSNRSVEPSRPGRPPADRSYSVRECPHRLVWHRSSSARLGGVPTAMIGEHKPAYRAPLSAQFARTQKAASISHARHLAR